MPSCCVWESELYLAAILSTRLFRMMVKLTMRWIMFPFGHEEIFFLSLFLHGRSDCHFIAVNLNGLCHVLLGKKLAVIFIRGGMARAAQLPHVSTVSVFNHFPWESGLGADKLACSWEYCTRSISLKQDSLTFLQSKQSTLKRYNISCNTPSGWDSRPPCSWQSVTWEYQTKG